MKDNAMNLTEARHLLSITEKDDLHTLKKKYHRLMSECHPDALGSERPEHVERAQKTILSGSKGKISVESEGRGLPVIPDQHS